MNYRAEIDGLRAIAVISVVLYHSQLLIFGRDWFKGGYIGVDIFFVISGYLITRIILKEVQETNSFSFSAFYERRARRILPMLFLVIAACFPFGWLELLPLDLIDLAKSALSAIGFGSNFFFYFSTTEYGAASAFLKPLLHTWSLGVEEQFYIFFPILMLLIWKLGRASTLTLFLGLSIFSIQFADVMEPKNSELNFFFPVSRFWELLVGSMLAHIEIKYGRTRNPVVVQTLPILGLYLIIHSILFFDSNTRHPSFHTLTPVVGVALIIAFCSTNDLVGKALSFRPMVGLGLISYSLYLWHFPIFAFSRVTKENLSSSDTLKLIIFAFALSVLSYFFVEKPFRNKKLVSVKTLLFTLATFGFLISTLSILVVLNDGYRVRHYSNLTISPNIEYASISEKFALVGNNCNVIGDIGYSEISVCEAGDVNSDRVINVIGDSHAAALFHSFDDFGKKNGIKFMRYDMPGCSSFIDNVEKGDGHKVSNCRGVFDNVVKVLGKERNDLIIVFRWMFQLYPIDGYELDMPLKNKAGVVENESYRANFIFHNGSYLASEPAKTESLKRFLEKLISSSKRTFILSPVPEVAYDIERVNRNYFIENGWNEVLQTLSIGYDEYLTRNLFFNKFFSTFDAESAKLIRVENIFCNSFMEGQCVAQFNGVPFYYDDDHLSKIGADMVVELLAEELTNESFDTQ